MAKRLTGRWDGYYRFRLGDYRIVYQVDDKALLVAVAITAHRSEVYR